MRRSGILLSHRLVAFAHQPGGRGEAREVAAPEGLFQRQVLTLQPGDVVAVGPGRREVGRAAGGEGPVAGEEFLEQHALRPAVHQQVMAARDDLVLARRQLVERQAKEWRRGELEAALALGREMTREPRPLLVTVEPAPGVVRDFELGAVEDHLERLFEVLPEEAGAQDGVARHEVLPGAAEDGGVEPAGNAPAQADAVDPGLRREERVEQDALLERR